MSALYKSGNIVLVIFDLTKLILGFAFGFIRAGSFIMIK